MPKTSSFHFIVSLHLLKVFSFLMNTHLHPSEPSFLDATSIYLRNPLSKEIGLQFINTGKVISSKVSFKGWEYSVFVGCQVRAIWYITQNFHIHVFESFLNMYNMMHRSITLVNPNSTPRYFLLAFQ